MTKKAGIMNDGRAIFLLKPPGLLTSPGILLEEVSEQAQVVPLFVLCFLLTGINLSSAWRAAVGLTVLIVRAILKVRQSS